VAPDAGVVGGVLGVEGGAGIRGGLPVGAALDGGGRRARHPRAGDRDRAGHPGVEQAQEPDGGARRDVEPDQEVRLAVGRQRAGVERGRAVIAAWPCWSPAGRVGWGQHGRVDLRLRRPVVGVTDERRELPAGLLGGGAGGQYGGGVQTVRGGRPGEVQHIPLVHDGAAAWEEVGVLEVMPAG
jgi:hypothetical protein